MRVFGSPGPQTNQEKEAKICRRTLKKGKESYRVSGLAMVTVWHNRGGNRTRELVENKKGFQSQVSNRSRSGNGLILSWHNQS